MDRCSLHDEDAGVKKTNSDAQCAKLACVLKGYFSDEYVRHFVKKSDLARARSLPPLINRGYYARHVLIKALLMHFVKYSTRRNPSVSTSPTGSTACPPLAPARSAASPSTIRDTGLPQVVVLGCGFDTLYFQLLKTRELSADVLYVECDFPDVAEMKKSIIDGLSLGTCRSAEISLDKYALIGADLRDVDGLMIKLEEAGLRRDVPTFFLAECVLVYMDMEHSNKLLRRLSAEFRSAMCVVYEQVNPNDAFGRQMMVNLRARGCPLKGVLDSLEAQRQRMIRCGWEDARSEHLLGLFNTCIQKEDIARIKRIEMMDEEEEWNLLLQHYSITVARTGDSTPPLFRGML